jgi:hypothetical protein
MERSQAHPSSKRDWKRLAVNVFIAFHLIAISFWALPGSQFRDKMVAPFGHYMMTLGLWQSWDMFSPNPLSLTIRLDAEITYRDGTRERWEFPQPEKLGLIERSLKERYRKWRERVRLDTYSYIWPDTARAIARRHSRPDNPPVKVALTRYWAELPRPAPRDYQPIPKSYDAIFRYLFFEYQVQPADLL